MNKKNFLIGGLLTKTIKGAYKAYRKKGGTVATKRKSTGKDAKPELFYVETKSNGTLTFPFPREFTNTEQLTRQVMAGRGGLNYDPKIFERLSNRQSGL